MIKLSQASLKSVNKIYGDSFLTPFSHSLWYFIRQSIPYLQLWKKKASIKDLVDSNYLMELKYRVISKLSKHFLSALLQSNSLNRIIFSLSKNLRCQNISLKSFAKNAFNLLKKRQTNSVAKALFTIISSNEVSTLFPICIYHCYHYCNIWWIIPMITYNEQLKVNNMANNTADHFQNWQKFGAKFWWIGGQVKKWTFSQIFSFQRRKLRGKAQHFPP